MNESVMNGSDFVTQSSLSRVWVPKKEKGREREGKRPRERERVIHSEREAQSRLCGAKLVNDFAKLVNDFKHFTIFKIFFMIQSRHIT